MNRLPDVANIYGSIAGAMPGSPTQKFAPNPIVQGIGGFANMYSTLGGWTGGQQQQQQPPAGLMQSYYQNPNMIT